MSIINQATITTNGVVRPTLVEVNLDRLASNFQAVRDKVAPARIMPILKANAYGHGLIEVARHMVALGADCLGVAVLEEGILLREQGIRSSHPGAGRHPGQPGPAFFEAQPDPDRLVGR